MILNLAAYHFVVIENVAELVNAIRSQCERENLMGTVLVTPEGINCFLAGEANCLRSFLTWLKSDVRFAAIQTKLSESAHVPFKRLRVKLKKEIITFRKTGVTPLPGASCTHAPAVAPSDLARWLAQGHDDDGRAVVMVDTRNAQEVEFGTFENALTLPIEKFTDLPDALENHRTALQDKTIVSFCTGGIRCEKAAPWMLDAGYKNVWQLEGGILGYFEKVGGAHYRGGCFVFDERISLNPDLTPLRDEAVTLEQGPAALREALQSQTSIASFETGRNA